MTTNEQEQGVNTTSNVDDATSERQDRAAQIDEILVDQLVQGANYRAAGAAAKVSAKTVMRRMQQPEFRRRVAEGRAELLGQLAGRAANLGQEAIDAIRVVMAEGIPGERLRAADLLLNVAARLHDNIDISTQVKELRDELRALQGEGEDGDE